MSILNELASSQNRRDEEPNQELARRLCEIEEVDVVREDIQELVDNLTNKDKAIRSDCIKVLDEISAIKPELIESYVDEFVALLIGKDNRMIWGAMTALGRIAPRKPHDIWKHVDMILNATENGSVITQDWGIRVLAELSASNTDYAKIIYPFLIHFLERCRYKDVPKHAESILIAAQSEQQQSQLWQVLEQHQPNLTARQLKRVQKILDQL